MLDVVNAAIIVNSQLLIVKKRGVWILPGGKREGVEGDKACLEREVSEELARTEIRNLKYCCWFEGQSISGKPVRTSVYLAQAHGDIKGVSPGDSITDYAWFSRENMGEYDLSSLTRDIISHLIREQII